MSENRFVEANGGGVRRRRRATGPVLPEFQFAQEVESAAPPEPIDVEFQKEKMEPPAAESAVTVPATVPEPVPLSKPLPVNDSFPKEKSADLQDESTNPRRKTMKTTTSSPSPGISDFRRNAERQIKEQQSMGNLLSGVAYALIGGILLVGVLAGFGGYVLWKQIQNQSVTVAQMDAKYNSEVIALAEADERFQDKLEAVTKRNQEQFTRIVTQADEQSASLKRREKEIGSLQQRVRRLEEIQSSRLGR